MSDLIQLDRHQPAWKPTSDSVLLHVYHRYDMPLAGLIAQRGAVYAFRALYGEVDVHQVFAYVHVSEQLHEELQALPVRDREAAFDQLYSQAPDVRVVLHHEQAGILEVVDVPGGSYDAMLNAARQEAGEPLSTA